jgi:hypothetical protein
MDKRLKNQNVPDTARQKKPTQSSRQRWLQAIPTILVVIAALAQTVGVPFVSDTYSFLYGIGVSLLIGTLFWIAVKKIAVKVTPADEASGGQFVYFLSLVIPAVKTYLDEVNETNEINRINTIRYSNMESLLVAYKLPPATKLVVPVKELGEEPKTIEIPALAEKAAKAVVDNSATDDEVQRMSRLLELLYYHQFGLPPLPLWQKIRQDDKDKEKLSELLLDAGTFESTIRIESDARDQWVKTVRAVLGKISDFDISLVLDVTVRLNNLWTLATEFADDAKINGLCDKAKNWRGPAPSEAFLKFVDEDLPPTGSGLHRLEAQDLAVDLLRFVAKKLIGEMDPPPTGDPEKMAFVSVGLFLLAGHRYPKYHAELARQAHEGDLCDVAARVLLARIFCYEKNQDSKEPKVPLGDLLVEWEEWLKEADAAYGKQLQAKVLLAIRKQIRHGSWPTELPIGAMLDKWASYITEVSHLGEQHIEQAVYEFQGYLSKLGVDAEHNLTDPAQELLKKIEEFKPKAAEADRKRMMEDLIAASELAQAQPIEELVDAVHSVEDADNNLRDAVDRLTGAFPSGARRYLLTWKKKSGPLADLIEYLVKGPHEPGQPEVGRYEFEHFTPYARIGWLPLDQDFDAFSVGLAHDFAQVYRDRKKILPNYNSIHPSQDAEIYVRQIDAAVRITVPS